MVIVDQPLTGEPASPKGPPRSLLILVHRTCLRSDLRLLTDIPSHTAKRQLQQPARGPFALRGGSVQRPIRYGYFYGWQSHVADLNAILCRQCANVGKKKRKLKAMTRVLLRRVQNVRVFHPLETRGAFLLCKCRDPA